MKRLIKGRVHRLGHYISIHDIYPDLYLSLSDPVEMAEHALEGYDPELSSKINSGDIIIAGKNFGVGQRREQAILALKRAGIACVAANSFGRFFYREAMNSGLPLLEQPEAYEKIKDGETVDIDLGTGEIHCRKGALKFDPLPDFMMRMLDAGGLIQYTRETIRNQR
jgi:3-isopropylmalate/(R)-2-methylmalate dehydratase small subunit